MLDIRAERLFANRGIRYGENRHRDRDATERQVDCQLGVADQRRSSGHRHLRKGGDHTQQHGSDR
jgi:hypothetical protein